MDAVAYERKPTFLQLNHRWNADLLLSLNDWSIVDPEIAGGCMDHFLFYFKDETFECVAQSWKVELPIDKSLDADAQYQDAAPRRGLHTVDRQRWGS